jgi:hypothetical protein
MPSNLLFLGFLGCRIEPLGHEIKNNDRQCPDTDDQRHMGHQDQEEGHVLHGDTNCVWVGARLVWSGRDAEVPPKRDRCHINHGGKKCHGETTNVPAAGEPIKEPGHVQAHLDRMGDPAGS